MRKALILGCGYVGSEVARLLVERGVETLAVTRNEERIRELGAIGVQACNAQIDSHDWHEFADTKVDFILNCVSSAGGGIDGYRKSYLEGNRSLAALMAKRAFSGRAIYTSSVSVYPDAGGAWLSEEDADPDNERGAIILESERLFLNASEEASLAVLRLGGIYGPGRTIFARRISDASEPLPGRGDYFLNLTRLEDIVSAIMEVAFSETALKGVFNVVDDTPSLKQDIVSWISDKMGRPSPGFSGKADALGSRRGGSMPANRRISNEKLRKATGWRPRFASFREGYVGLLNGG